MLLFTLLLAAAQDTHAFPGADEDSGARPLVAAPRCDRAAEEIVVCGNADSDRFRLKPIAPRYAESPVRIQRNIGSGELSVEAEERALPGAASPAAMVRFRIPFGGKRKK